MEELKRLQEALDQEALDTESSVKFPVSYFDGYADGLTRASEGIGGILPDLEKKLSCLESDNAALKLRLAESEERCRKMAELPDRFICYCNESAEGLMTVFCKDQSIDRTERALRLMGACTVVDVLTIFIDFLDGEY